MVYHIASQRRYRRREHISDGSTCFLPHRSATIGSPPLPVCRLSRASYQQCFSSHNRVRVTRPSGFLTLGTRPGWPCREPRPCKCDVAQDEETLFWSLSTHIRDRALEGRSRRP